MSTSTSLPPPSATRSPAATEPSDSWAVLSCDLDPVDCHLLGYGIADAPRCDAIYRHAVPRLLDLLDELGLRAVFFTVARDAAHQRPLLREIVARGHEVASHSFNHPQPFRSLSAAALQHETESSRAALSDAVGSDVLGFRAPAWDVDERVAAALAAAGYRYDASLFPTPVLALARLVARWRGSHGDTPVAGMKSSAAFGPRHPHRFAGCALIEFPVSVTPWLRLPAYHTVSHLLPTLVFDRILNAALHARTPLSYQFHAADLLDLEHDGVDPRIAVHPGMDLPVERKLGTMRKIFKEIVTLRPVVTYGELLSDGAASA